VLTSLRPKARAIYQAARFVGNEGGEALVALPNEAHLLHAEPLKSDVAAALSSHFGRPIRIRLVVDTGQIPLRPVGAQNNPGSPSPQQRVPTEAEDQGPYGVLDAGTDGSGDIEDPVTSEPSTDPATQNGPARPAPSPEPSLDRDNGGIVTEPDDDVDYADLGTPLDPIEEAEVKGAGVAWAADRLREAFPGAEEV
jgi:hypothetical protein